MRVLVANPQLHYYQGYHDICVTILLVVNGDENLAFQIIEKVTTPRFVYYDPCTNNSNSLCIFMICAE